ncbi:hypothetical protein BDA99DRAFT_554833 [Phascolomyces articulosus]|uniref:RRM domain-containing protein n=1 Tax=Phascolomyces articulosus TaxID=60185 RepID=A0AAD5KNC3_9FUNG|nr:hypothetical protein BDA99DRAFT_554833 [Phascolomyces articulosus]
MMNYNNQHRHHTNNIIYNSITAHNNNNAFLNQNTGPQGYQPLVNHQFLEKAVCARTYFTKKYGFVEKLSTAAPNNEYDEQQYLLTNDFSFLDTANQYEPPLGCFSYSRIKPSRPFHGSQKVKEYKCKQLDNDYIFGETQQQDKNIPVVHVDTQLRTTTSTLVPLTTVQERWSQLWKQDTSTSYENNLQKNSVLLVSNMPEDNLITNNSKQQQKQGQSTSSSWSKVVGTSSADVNSSQYNNIIQPKPVYSYQKYSVSTLEKAVQECTIKGEKENNHEKKSNQKITVNHQHDNALKLLSNSIAFHVTAVSKFAAVLKQTFYVAQISNIMIDKHTYKTQNVAFIEFESEEEFNSALAMLKTPLLLKGRVILITKSDEETLFRHVFPEWNGLFICEKPTYFVNDSDGQENTVFVPPRLVEKYEYDALLALCKNHKSRYMKKCPTRPFENFISMMVKFPWRHPEIITLMERDHLYEYYKLDIGMLREHMNKPKHPFKDSLMERMVRTVLLCPGISINQIKQILSASKTNCPSDLINYLDESSNSGLSTDNIASDEDGD